MKFNPDRHHRRSIRLKEYDYARAGAYFVTVCTNNKECLFGDVVEGNMTISQFGAVAMKCWVEIPNHFTGLSVDEFVIMPNHIHGILSFVGARHAVPELTTEPKSNVSPRETIEQFGKPVVGSLPTIIRSFKSTVTKKINQIRNLRGGPLWQRNYYEHVIRNENELNRIREYILKNPLKWELDRENPDTDILNRQEKREETWQI